MTTRALAVSTDGKPVCACICSIEDFADRAELDYYDGFNAKNLGEARRMWWPQESCRCGGTKWVCLMCHGAGRIISVTHGYKVIPCKNCATQSAEGLVTRRLMRVEARQVEYVESEWDRVYEHAA